MPRKKGIMGPDVYHEFDPGARLNCLILMSYGIVATDNGLGDYRTKAARTQESGKSSDCMDEEDDQIAHFLIIPKPGIARGWTPN